MRKILIDKSGVIHSVYNKSLHLLYRKIGRVSISSRVGNVYSKGADWYVTLSHVKPNGDIAYRIFGPFPTKEDAVERENKYIEENFSCFI